MSKTMDNDWDEHVSEVLTLRARVEELEADRKSLLAQRAERNITIRDLRSTVDRLECLGYTDIYEALEKERDELREKLAALQPPAPTIVKQVWSPIGPNGSGLNPFASREAAYNYKADTAIAMLRRDHMSDGTVVATLETIGEKE